MSIGWKSLATTVLLVGGVASLGGCVYDPYYDPYATGYYAAPAPAPAPAYPYYYSRP